MQVNNSGSNLSNGNISKCFARPSASELVVRLAAASLVSFM
jgi:hypothetical protein